MMLHSPGVGRAVRVHVAFVRDHEAGQVEQVVHHPALDVHVELRV